MDCATFAGRAGLQGTTSRPLPSDTPGHGCPQGTELLLLTPGQEDTCVLAQLLSPCALPPATSRVQRVPEGPLGGHLGGQGPALCPVRDTWRCHAPFQWRPSLCVASSRSILGYEDLGLRLSHLSWLPGPRGPHRGWGIHTSVPQVSSRRCRQRGSGVPAALRTGQPPSPPPHAHTLRSQRPGAQRPLPCLWLAAPLELGQGEPRTRGPMAKNTWVPKPLNRALQSFACGTEFAQRLERGGV